MSVAPPANEIQTSNLAFGNVKTEKKSRKLWESNLAHGKMEPVDSPDDSLRDTQLPRLGSNCSLRNDFPRLEQEENKAYGAY